MSDPIFTLKVNQGSSEKLSLNVGNKSSSLNDLTQLHTLVTQSNANVVSTAADVVLAEAAKTAAETALAGAETAESNIVAASAKLDGIEDNATADQTATEIRTLTESATDSNVFTDADKTLLSTALQLAGGSMLGALTLLGDPGSALEASTRQYTDARGYKRSYVSVPAMRADATFTPATVSNGDYIRAGAYDYIVSGTDDGVNAVGGVNLTILFDGMPSIEQFGAEAGEVCTDEIDAWVDYLVANDKIGYAPGGVWKTTGLKSVTQAKFVTGIVGDGSATQFECITGNTDGFLQFIAQGRDSFFFFSNFDVLRSGSAGGVGLEASMVEGGARHSSSHYLNNIRVSIVDETDDTVFFDNGLVTKAAWHGQYTNVQVNGPGVGQDATASSPHFKMNIGWNMESNYRPTLTDCSVWSALHAIEADVYRAPITLAADNGAGGTRITMSSSTLAFSTGASVKLNNSTEYPSTYTSTRINDTTVDINVVFNGNTVGAEMVSDHAPEDFRISNLNMVNVKTGLRLTRPAGREPVFQWRGGHVNAIEVALQVNGMKFLDITGVAFYNEDAASDYGGTYRDIHIINGSGYRIQGNRFHYNGHPLRIGIHVENDGSADSGDNGIITHNTVTMAGQEFVRLASGVNNVTVRMNDGANSTLTGSFVQDNGPGNDVQSGVTDILPTVSNITSVQVVDLDAITDTGFFEIHADDAATGNAPTDHPYLVTCHIFDVNSAQQYAQRAGVAETQDRWVRSKSGGTWQTWNRMLVTDDDGHVLIKGATGSGKVLIENLVGTQLWSMIANNGDGSFRIRDETAGLNSVLVDPGTPSGAIHAYSTGVVEIGALLKLKPQGSAPTAVVGGMYFDNATSQFMVCKSTGVGWIVLA